MNKLFFSSLTTLLLSLLKLGNRVEMLEKENELTQLRNKDDENDDDYDANNNDNNYDSGANDKDTDYDDDYADDNGTNDGDHAAYDIDKIDKSDVEPEQMITTSGNEKRNTTIGPIKSKKRKVTSSLAEKKKSSKKVSTMSTFEPFNPGCMII